MLPLTQSIRVTTMHRLYRLARRPQIAEIDTREVANLLVIVIGLVMFGIGALMLHRATRIINIEVGEGFNRTDIGSLGELRTKVANLEATVAQLMHSGQVPTLDPEHYDRRVTT